MNAGPSSGGEAKFGRYVDHYDEALDRGLSLAGENRTFFARGRLAHLRSCLDRLGATAGAVVEFGCGDGSSTPLVFETLGASSLLGVDPTDAFVRKAQDAYGSARARFRTLEAARAEGGADTAYCNGVFHHIEPERRAEAVAWVREALKPGGLFGLWDNNPFNPGARWVMRRIPFDRDTRPLSAGEAARLLEAGGFEILRTDFLFVFPRPLAWLRKTEEWLSGWPLGAQYQVLARKPGRPADGAPPG